METDSFFCQLLKELPEAFFELLDLPPEKALYYRFDAVELKKSFRIDGVFLPQRADLPLYFVEIQFQGLPAFYANLFAKVFCYLEENDPAQEWIAVAVFRGRSVEPKHLKPYEDLLQSKRVRRIYLNELPISADPPVGLGILQLMSAPVSDAKSLVSRLLRKAMTSADAEEREKVIELVEELLVRRFHRLHREEIRAMFQLEDLRKTRVWQEAREEGLEQGLEQGQTLVKRELVKKWSARGMSPKEIASLLEISVPEVRRLAKNTSR